MSMRLLVLGAHTDDIELMCGGTILRFINSGYDVYYCTFSFANKSLLEGFPDNITKQEALKATSILGIPSDNIHMFDYEVREFPKYRQKILEDLVTLRKVVRPHLVITHNSDDTHQDHEIISNEAYRAFKQSSSIWGYESFKNNRTFNSNIYVKLDSDDINKKIEALSVFKSQIVKCNNLDAIKALARFRGSQVNAEYAECFQLLRMLL